MTVMKSGTQSEGIVAITGKY